MIRSGTTSYYHADGLGSVTTLTNTSGAVVERAAYDAYGQTQLTNAAGTVLAGSAVGNRFGFTGRELDGKTGLYYYRARIYSPTLGRFLQRDPVSDDSLGNLYRYAENNPSLLVDPNGRTVLVGAIPAVLVGAEELAAGLAIVGGALVSTPVLIGIAVVAGVAAIGLTIAANRSRSATKSMGPLQGTKPPKGPQQLLRNSTEDGGKAPPPQQVSSAIRRINNAIRDPLEPGPYGDISGTTAQMLGRTIRDQFGQVVDHVQEMTATLKGLRGNSRILEGVTGEAASAARQAASEATQAIVEAIQGLGI